MEMGRPAKVGRTDMWYRLIPILRNSVIGRFWRSVMSKMAYFITGVFLLAWASWATGATIYVDDSALGANTGSKWADAYVFLQDALATAQSGDKVWVAQGIYKPDEEGGNIAGDRGASFQMRSGVKIYGGYPSGGGQLEERNPKIFETILSGDIGLAAWHYDNSYHVVRGTGADETALLDGFTICDGWASVGSMYVQPDDRGGGVYYGSHTMNNCVVRDNHAFLTCGGMYVFEGTISNSIITNNEASYSCGGMWLVNGRAYNCIVSNNRATWTPSGGAGGVGLTDGLLSNCTIVGNTATIGSGIYTNRSNTIVNCIVRNNTGGDQIAMGFENIITSIAHSNIQGGWPGVGNLDMDPLFVDVSGGDFHLQSASLCIDAGDSVAVPSWVTTDLDGNPRIQGVAVDMGAYETAGSPQDVLDTTIGIVAGLDPGSLTNPNTGDTLVNKLQATIALIEAGLYRDAMMKLQHDILPKTDGCALRGQPDKDDWIITCEGQQQVYPLVLQAIQLLQSI